MIVIGAGAIGAGACAEGYAGPDALGYSLTPIVPEQPDGGTAGTGAMSGMGAPEPPPFTGEPCVMGQMETCTCTDGVSMGVKICRADDASPTGGAFSACEACVMPMPPPEAGMGGAAGAAGMDGAGTGASGMGASGTGASGTGASGTGASGTGASGTGSGGCNPSNCEQPFLGEACCTEDGECGVRLLLSCRAN